MVKQIGLFFRNTETDREYRVNLSPGRDYIAVSLPSGGYVMDKVVVSITETETKYSEVREEWVSPISFFLEKNVIFFSNYTLLFKDDGDWFDLLSSRSRTPEKAAEIYEELKQQPRWAAWEEAQLIGLDG